MICIRPPQGARYRAPAGVLGRGLLAIRLTTSQNGAPFDICRPASGRQRLAGELWQLGGAKAGPPMLQNLSADVRECQRRAEECRHKAELATDPLVKADFLDMELRWLNLAESYQFCEQLARYIRQQNRP